MEQETMMQESTIQETTEQENTSAAESMENTGEAVSDAGEKVTEPAKPWNTPENARFAQQRRQQEAQNAAFKSLIGDITNPATGKPFASAEEWNSWKQSAAMAIQAKQANVSPDVFAKVVDRVREDVKKTDPDILRQRQQLEEYRQREAQSIFAADLKAIKKAYPDEKAKSVEELGDQFIRLCAAGISPLSAYEAIRAEKNRGAKQPPSMGDIRPGGGGKEYFTRDEVKAMSQAEVHRNYDKIRESMKKW